MRCCFVGFGLLTICWQHTLAVQVWLLLNGFGGFYSCNCPPLTSLAVGFGLFGTQSGVVGFAALSVESAESRLVDAQWVWGVLQVPAFHQPGILQTASTKLVQQQTVPPWGFMQV